MGCRLIEGHEVGSPEFPLFLFYDSVSGVAFTPVFHSEDEALSFERFATEKESVEDLRQIDSNRLWELVGPWNDAWVSANGER